MHLAERGLFGFRVFADARILLRRGVTVLLGENSVIRGELAHLGPTRLAVGVPLATEARLHDRGVAPTD